MHTAQVTAWGQSPTWISTADLPPPNDSEVRIKVKAVGIHRIVRSRAAGQHYSAKALPHIPGIDGVGTTADGQQVYFVTFGPGSSGALSDYVNVPKQAVFALPGNADPLQIAALVNPALSSWLAMTARGAPLPKDFSVLIIGATSASGRIAVDVAGALGAKQVIGAARNVEAMTLGDVNPVLDYVCGLVTEQLFRQLNSQRPTTYVQIGTLAGGSISLPGDLLRSKNVTIRGSGPGAWSMRESAELMPDLLKIMPSLGREPVRTAKFSEVETAWATSGAERLVFVP